ncbi:Phox/Bem1p [Macleaya cordata]|uniref:Phox/Bem1p n=1 Tax=Macleaya cordata TaxID=56857 RepID=A0A200PQX1_MACCD|nr:Phox/Bem1p [Macleaya cordata]
MEDGRFPLDNMSGALSDPSADFDLMDELLLGGCWLETTEGSDFLQPSSSNSTAFFNSSYFLPTTSEGLNPNPPQNNSQEETGGPIVPRNPSSLEPQTETSIATRYLNQNTFQIAECTGQSERTPIEGSFELSRRWWIGPSTNSRPLSSVRDRLIHALGNIKDSIKHGDVLIQIWVPVKRGGKQVLITNDQPFSLDTSCQRLISYRNVSMKYQFPADEDSNESVGLPGRVFLGKVPEWTPDVRFFSSDEYPRIDHAQLYDVRGTLALPIFERGSRSCLGVVEVVMTTQKINYRPELENVCRALEAVNLRGSEVASPPVVKAPHVSYQAVLPEILEVLRAVCETHRLPLAQTWVPCILQGKEGCRHSDENYTNCVSTVDSACCVADPQILGFHEACSEHHLFRGQGVAGRAFRTNQPCFSSNITTFSKKDYPLSHYARMFGLQAAVAIRLRSIYTGTVDYVLEFFLPVNCRDIEEQKMMLSSLSIIIQQVCRSLRVVMDKELEEETNLNTSEVVVPSNEGPNREVMPNLGPAPSKGSSEEESSWITHMMEAQRKGKSLQKEEPTEGFKVTTHWDSPEVVLQPGQTFTEFKQHRQDSGLKDNAESGGDSSLGDRRFSSMSKTGEKRRTKMEKTISLQVLRQYFAGSLKDAAKSIGVCPTTLKRICRQHGITRWPSRKIKKVGHSLRKLQVVIDSVQGAEGAFQIGSIYANFPELTSPNLSGTSPFSASKPNDQSNPSNTQPEGGGFSPQAAASKSPSSSCSQSSSSSLCCSSGKQQNPLIGLAGNEDASMAETAGGTLKRARSDAELHSTGQEDPGFLARSQSQKCFSEHPSLDDSLPPLPNSSRFCRDRGALRMKVTYGEEKVRFSMQLNWVFKDLQQEIAKRFHIDDMSRIDLKYLDDDSEWVLLTCDADLEECMDIYKSSQTQTIKLSVHHASLPNLGSSFGSNAP